jgi:TPR repeat protein
MRQVKHKVTRHKGTGAGFEAYAQAMAEVEAKGPTRRYFRLLQHAVENGSAEAMTDLGMWLLEGGSVVRKFGSREPLRGAIALLRRAAVAKSSKAQLALGNCYADGSGVRKDRLVAEKYYRAAAAAGEAFAAYNLATLFRDRREWRMERSWLGRATALGDETAPLVLAEIDLTSRHKERAHAAAQYLRRKARGANETVASEAQEILESFGRTGMRRWVPSESGR